MRHRQLHHAEARAAVLAERGRPGGGLPALARAADPEWMSGLLQETLRTERRVAGVGVEILRRRKRRCVLRYRVRFGAAADAAAGCDGAAGSGQEVSFIGKLYRGDLGRPVYELMEDLARHGFARDAADGISIPGVEAYLAEMGLLVQEEVGGRPVTEWLRTPDAAYAMQRLAAAVAKLHRCPLRPGAPWGLAQHLGRCHPSPQALQEAVPEVREPVDALLAGAARLLAERRPREWALIHGDLHFAQVHVSSARTWLIDLDAACVADPAADLGNLLVFLHSKSRRRVDVRRLGEVFLDAYFGEMPEDILKRVPVFQALTHLRRACKRLRLREDGWRKRVRRTIDAGLRSLAGAALHDGEEAHG